VYGNGLPPGSATEAAVAKYVPVVTIENWRRLSGPSWSSLKAS
jgi:hypothetical protein